MTNPLSEAELMQGHGARVSVTYDVEVWIQRKWLPFFCGRSEENARQLIETVKPQRARIVRVTTEMKREVL